MSIKSSQNLPILPPLIAQDDLVQTLNDRFRKLMVMIAQRSGSSSILYGTHAARMALQPAKNPSALYVETDRNYIMYLSDGKQWHFAAGIMYGPLASRPNGLSVGDEGLYYLTSDQPVTLYRWTKGAWTITLGSLPWSFQGRFSDLTTYSTGDVVSFEGTLWISAVDNNTGIFPTNPPSDPPAWYLANWQRLADVSAFGAEEWDASTSYGVDAVVAYLGDLWVAKSANTGAAPALQYPGDPVNPWLPIDADNIVISGNLVGHGLNLRWNGTNWISGISPDNGGGAVLVDATTGIVTLVAIAEVPNAAPPNNPIPQILSPTLINDGAFLQADPRQNLTDDGSFPCITSMWPIDQSQWLVIMNHADKLHCARARFDLTPMITSVPVDRVFQLPDNLDPAGDNVTLAGIDPCHGGTGITNVPADGHGWAAGDLLVGTAPDATALLPPGSDHQALLILAGVPGWAPIGTAGAGVYGDASHVAQVTIDAFGRVTSITSVAITFPGGFSGTVTLAKLTGGGTNGALTVVNGLITGVLPPT